MRKITFPLVIPAIASGFIMTFSKTMGTFGGPNVLGVPVQYYTLSTMLRSNTGIGNYGDGFVLAIVLILFAMTTVMLNQRLVGTRKSYETIGGRGFMSTESQTSQLETFSHGSDGCLPVHHCCPADDPADLQYPDAANSGDYSLSIISPWHTGLDRGST